MTEQRTQASAGQGAGGAPLSVLVCGAVESGTTTLIGRLLQETGASAGGDVAAPCVVPEIHARLVEGVRYSMLVAGADAEVVEADRAQSARPDAAARVIPKRHRLIVLADVPGGGPFTRQLGAAAAQTEIAVLVVDARSGLTEQTERHASICGLMGVRHIILAVNKMDLVGFAQDAFERIVTAFQAFAEPLGFVSIFAIPIAAQAGDGVTRVSEKLGWHRGATLLGQLDATDVRSPGHVLPFRFPVQRAVRLDDGALGLAGVVLSGQISVGADVVSAVSGRPTRIKRIVRGDTEVDLAGKSDAVVLVLGDDVDVARGDLLVPATLRPEVSDQFAAQMLWLDRTHLLPGRSYELHIGSRSVPASVTAIKHRVDLHSRQHLAARNLEINEIGVCNLATAAPIAFDAFAENRDAGSFVLVDRMTNATVAMGMIMFGLRRATNIHVEELFVEKAQRASAKHQRATAIWFTGLSGSGKSTIAKRLEKRLHDLGHHTYVLDGDNVRHGLNQDLGFTDTDRVENIRRIGEVAKLFVDSGLIVMCSFISPFRAERRMVRALLEPGEFVEVFVDASIEECKRRDPKGLYAKALAGKVKNFTGIDSPYEPPEQAEIRLVTENSDPDQVVDQLLGYLRENGRI